jgi:membrane-bound lytic murein transglycosylase MltF
MIKQESRFNHEAVSERGAQGLMQIMPVTHSEIAEEIDVQDPFLPRENLRAGIYYVSKLTELFKNVKGDDRTRLVLAAYNAGPSRIYDAQELAAYLGEDPHSWTSIRNVLPLLSKRYYSLHQSVWGSSRPPNGYYGSSNQTIRYVENIMKTFHNYCDPM